MHEHACGIAQSHILIIEDDMALTEMLADFLRSHGFQATVAADGQEGVRILQSLTPDIIILDYVLPLLDGLEVLSRVRAGEHHIPVIMLTSQKDVENIIEGFNKGADDYVTKPFSPLDLLHRIRSLLGRNNSP